MTIDELKERVRVQTGIDLELTNDHRMRLKQALVPPQKITITVQLVRNGKIKEHAEQVWLVGREPSKDGYCIIMRDDGMQFGLAYGDSSQHGVPTFVGWYGNLVQAFLAM